MVTRRGRRTWKPSDAFYDRPAWHKMRAAILRRDGYRCTNCGRSVQGKGQSRVDHIKPLRQRPDLALDPANLRTLCVPCDIARHARDRHGGADKTSPPIRADGFPEGWGS